MQQDSLNSFLSQNRQTKGQAALEAMMDGDGISTQLGIPQISQMTAGEISTLFKSNFKIDFRFRRLIIFILRKSCFHFSGQ